MNLKWSNPVDDMNYNEVHTAEFECGRLSDSNVCKITVYAENRFAIAYAEKCVRALNSLSEEVLCRVFSGLADAFRESGIANVKSNANEREVLSVCRSVTMYVSAPNDESRLLYVVECKADGGKAGFVMSDDIPVYIGSDYFRQYRQFKEV